MNVSVRLSQPLDLERLLRFHTHFVPKGAFRGLPPTGLAEVQEWLHELSKAGVEQFVVDTGERVIGHGVLVPQPDKPEAEVMLFIHQDYRGLGLGKALLLGMLNHACKKLHLKRVRAYVDKSNGRARALFDRAGFYAIERDQQLEMELEMERPSDCEKCKGDRCVVYGKPLPQFVQLPTRFVSKTLNLWHPPSHGPPR